MRTVIILNIIASILFFCGMTIFFVKWLIAEFKLADMGESEIIEKKGEKRNGRK